MGGSVEHFALGLIHTYVLTPEGFGQGRLRYPVTRVAFEKPFAGSRRPSYSAFFRLRYPHETNSLPGAYNSAAA